MGRESYDRSMDRNAPPRATGAAEGECLRNQLGEENVGKEVASIPNRVGRVGEVGALNTRRRPFGTGLRPKPNRFGVSPAL